MSTQGSEPTKELAEANLASSSARSLPVITLWPQQVLFVYKKLINFRITAPSSRKASIGNLNDLVAGLVNSLYTFVRTSLKHFCIKVRFLFIRILTSDLS